MSQDTSDAGEGSYETLTDEDRTSSQEPPQEYHTGGYCHIELDQILNHKYQVIRKLGWGFFSTAWLCKNLDTSNYVAIKVGKSRQSIIELFYSERESFERISELSTIIHPGKEHVLHMLDNFDYKPLKRCHLCLVFEVMGKDLLKLIKQYDYQGIPLRVTKRIVKHMLLGLSFLHDVCEIMHTDIKPENVAMVATQEDIQELINERLQYDNDKQYPESIVSRCPPYIAKRYRPHEEFIANSHDNNSLIDDMAKMSVTSSLEVSSTNDDYGSVTSLPPTSYEYILMERTFKIIDLGNAVPKREYQDISICTLEYRCPETILGSPLNETSDIWATACTAFELATGDYLFEPELNCNNHDNPNKNYNEVERREKIDHDHLYQMITLFGYIPKSIFRNGNRYRKHFNRDGRLHQNCSFYHSSLFDLLVQKYEWDNLSALRFSDFLIPMFNYDYRQRPSAEKMLAHSWLHDV